MVVEFITGVVNVLPVPNELPPDAASYQLVVDPTGGQTFVTSKFTIPGPHRDASTAVNEGVVIPTL